MPDRLTFGALITHYRSSCNGRLALCSVFLAFPKYSVDKGVLLVRRLVWVLVHSSENKDVNRGLRFAEELLRDKSLNAQDQRDLVYLTAVASYKLGKVCARRLQGVPLQGVYILFITPCAAVLYSLESW